MDTVKWKTPTEAKQVLDSIQADFERVATHLDYSFSERLSGERRTTLTFEVMDKNTFSCEASVPNSDWSYEFMMTSREFRDYVWKSTNPKTCSNADALSLISFLIYQQRAYAR